MILKQEPREKQASTTPADILKGMKVRAHFRDSTLAWFTITSFRDYSIFVNV